MRNETPLLPSTRRRLYLSDQEQAFIGWDRNVDFNSEKARLEQAVAETRNRTEKSFYAIALLQLTNGCRRNETLAAAFLWAENPRRELRIKTEKRKDKYMRLVVIPEIFSKYDETLKKGITDIQSMPRPHDAYYYFCTSRLGHNTHSMRYAFVGDASHKHPVQLISKMTGQKSMDTVLRYVQQKEAEKALRERFGLEEGEN